MYEATGRVLTSQGTGQDGPRLGAVSSLPGQLQSASDAPARRVGRRFAVGLAATLIAVALVRTQLIDVVRVSSDSMAPTLCTGGTALVTKMRAGSAVHVDDIVTFAGPTDGAATIKRVVAVQGQTVAIEDARLLVDGQLVEEPYVDHATIDGIYFGPVQVPEASVFLLGDHREVSVDSRAFGPVPLSRLDGRMLTTLATACSP